MARDVDPDSPLVGWREWVALPGLGVEAIKAKIDTGARTSALHAFDLEVIPGDGASRVRFSVHPIQRRDDIVITCEHDIAERREIRSSNGETEERIVIETDVVVGGTTHRIDLSLTNRDEMGFRMLLGRSALRGVHVVDPGRSYLTGLTEAARAAKADTPSKDTR